MNTVDQCPAAHGEDRRACVGPADAVTVTDRQGASTGGCVLHAAVLLASLDGGRVAPGPRTFTGAGDIPPGAAIATHTLAQQLPPYAWYGDAAEQAAALLHQHRRDGYFDCP